MMFKHQATSIYPEGEQHMFNMIYSGLESNKMDNKKNLYLEHSIFKKKKKRNKSHIDDLLL